MGVISLGLVRLLTGRMHQIRAHLTSENFPVIGDKEYGNAALTRIAATDHKITRQLLHSFSYTLQDTYTRSERTIQAPLPEDIQRLFPTIDVATIIAERDTYEKA